MHPIPPGTSLALAHAYCMVVMSVLGALGNAGVPPGGLVNYLLMPLWLVAVSVIIVRHPRVRA